MEGGACIGCLRTLDEIAQWRNMALDERMRLLEELKWRGATHACPKCQEPAYCAMEAGKSSNTCWCMEVPKDFNPDTDATDCLCKDCLGKQ